MSFCDLRRSFRCVLNASKDVFLMEISGLVEYSVAVEFSASLDVKT